MFEMTKMSLAGVGELRPMSRTINADSGGSDIDEATIKFAASIGSNRIVTKNGTEYDVAKLNRKKKASDVQMNLTAETKSKFRVLPSSSGKTLFFEKLNRKFTIKDLR